MTATPLPEASPEHAVAPAQADLAGHSRFVQRLRRRYADQLPLLAPGAPERAGMSECLAVLRARGLDTSGALRVLRQLVMERLATLDCDRQAPLAVVTRGVTELAELVLDVACADAFATLDARHGMPTNEDGSRCEFWVVGMGKLGGRELNVSSDIDLIYVYEADGETPGNTEGRGRTSHHEYFCSVVRIISQLVGDVTEHGFVFRVDLMLRPNGNSGPAAVSLAALEEYFVVQGREWERFAWLKSRVVAPRACLGGTAVLGLRSVVLPFVFRRYLDYNVFDGLRSLHRQIREHATRRSAGKPERANDVKLSRGGIREIEFTVQLLQLVRGGQFPELRHRSTLEALRRLNHAGLMDQETAAALADAYTFLRRVEHRIQYLDDQQTHAMPVADGDQEWLARSMAYPDLCPFLHDLDSHRERVAQEFDTLLGGSAGGGVCNGKGSCGKNANTPPDFDALLERLPATLRERMLEWRNHPRLNVLRDEDRNRLVRLLQRTAQWLEEGSVTEGSAVLMADWLEPLLRRQNYLALLLERPAVHRRLLHLLGTAKWPARYLKQHPGVIDELAGPSLLAERFSPVEYEDELRRRLASVTNTAEDDDETLLNLLRRAHHAEVFRTLARDVEGVIGVEQVADDLSALADATLCITARWCWQRLKQRHRDDTEPTFAIIGYGKLGGKELGYGSDLDIVFVYQDDDERAPEVYAAFVRKLINWLTVKTGEGDIYEIDTALRPNGSSGLLVTSFDAYAKYQEGRGSNTAWAWEHQAMTRARCVLAPAAEKGSDLRARFDAVREAVITAPRDPGALAKEIVAMREKVRAAHPVKPGRFDVKHSRGGMVDAEFVVQYLVLSASARFPELCDNVGNIALLRRAEAAGLLPAGVGQRAADAYRDLRREQHRARLDEESPQVPLDAMAEDRDAVRALWSAVFG